MSTPKTLTVMADYDCYPLWVSGPDDAYNISPEDLNLSSELIADLYAWQAVYDSILDHDTPQNTAFASKKAEINFIETGRALAKRVRAEVQPVYTVEYFDELTGKREIVI